MKKIFYILLITHLTVGFSYSQSGWFWQNPLPQGNNLSNLKMFGSSTGYTSNWDNILKTTNAGENWEVLYTGFNTDNTSLSMIDANTGYILLDSTKLIKTVNEGNNWFLVSNISGVSFPFELNFVTQNTGFILGRGGYLYFKGTHLLRTSNAGVNWNTQVLDTSFELYDINFPTENIGYASGSKNLWFASRYHMVIYKTTDRGITWDSVQNQILLNARCVDFLNENTGYVGGQQNSRGKMYKTTDACASWNIIDTSFSSSVTHIYFLNVETGFAMDLSSRIYKTTNSGQNWTTIELYTDIGNYYIYQLAFTDINTGIGIGSGGLLMKTTNGGINWVKKTSGSNRLLWDIKFSGLNTGFAGGDYGTLLKTTNGGLNWELIQFNWEDDFSGIVSIDEQNWYMAAAHYGKIFKTTNAGVTWDTLHTNLAQVTRIDFINQNTGFGICKYLAFFKTTNGGNNWISNNNLNDGQNWSLDFVNENTGYAGGYHTHKTTNGGLNWDTISFGFPFYSADIQFLNVNTGFICGTGYNEYTGFVMKTTNGGFNWSATEFADQPLEDLFFVDENTGFVLYGNQLFRTTNGGVNWYQLRTCSNNYLTVSFFNNPTTGYIVGYNGTIIKTTNGGGEPIGIQSISEKIPTHFILHQNYPNPFNPSTTIKFSIPSPKGMIKLTIYDILGREVAVLVHERLSPGIYEAEWNATNYASGIYFYRLETNDFSVTKKMVLIK